LHTDDDDHTLQSLSIDLSRLLADADPTGARPRRNVQPRNDPLPSETLDDWLCEAAMRAVEQQTPIMLTHAIRNTDRTVGARLAGEIARRYGDAGLPPHTIVCRFEGSAGQSLGAFCINGMRLELWGDANDYVGKGMAGGEIVMRPSARARFATQDNFIVGNTVLYGATGGALFAAGRAGERFAVRNSGATAVVEGVGDHGCEYMTGGTVVVLGATGRNFGAGMTGGSAFVYDDGEKFLSRLNAELVRAERLANDADAMQLYGLIERHGQQTSSAWAQRLLEQWHTALAQFWKVIPR